MCLNIIVILLLIIIKHFLIKFFLDRIDLFWQNFISREQVSSIKFLIQIMHSIHLKNLFIELLLILFTFVEIF